jgi:hypothetical protein
VGETNAKVRKRPLERSQKEIVAPSDKLVESELGLPRISRRDNPVKVDGAPRLLTFCKLSLRIRLTIPSRRDGNIAMNAHTSIVEQDDLSQNLQQLADEHKGRLRRIAIRDQRNNYGWFMSWLLSPRARSKSGPLWWLAPTTWAVVFTVGFLVTDQAWDAFGQFLGRLGL